MLYTPVRLKTRSRSPRREKKTFPSFHPQACLTLRLTAGELASHYQIDIGSNAVYNPSFSSLGSSLAGSSTPTPAIPSLERHHPIPSPSSSCCYSRSIPQSTPEAKGIAWMQDVTSLEGLRDNEVQNAVGDYVGFTHDEQLWSLDGKGLQPQSLPEPWMHYVVEHSSSLILGADAALEGITNRKGQ
ncbi:hypothetical protein CYLTODRAFT_412350 [Cylindrobasidium torrendii FP15055 ss-10]|uniref:Uncharacterized protein n=1 Tax=Cylindrobasidium torrendii FP15055 ss-10 TaxID=1314674 RepID=A0A0D7B6C1_9AGAR|nr:hypothetical protein CYLTODRAFT_412350 [Cylindrobasidium torrendii FP15055 ss-10]